MLYRNKKTGVVVDINSEASGSWEPVKAEKKEKKKTTSDEKKKSGKDK